MKLPKCKVCGGDTELVEWVIAGGISKSAVCKDEGCWGEEELEFLPDRRTK